MPKHKLNLIVKKTKQKDGYVSRLNLWTQKDATTPCKGHLSLYMEGLFFLTHKIGFGFALAYYMPILLLNNFSSKFICKGPKHV